ncbi:MAG: DUF2157 domain-containing protein [Dehalococcoidia bacterium]|nr:MAG: DUF2157 domain-containing protein [Dehalococcoidia bacterium]
MGAPVSASDRLQHDSAAWVTEGLISSEQRDLILAWDQRQERGRRSVTAILSILGAVIVAMGITLVVAANWQEIPLLVKLTVGVILLITIDGLGYWVRFGPLARVKSGDAVMLIGAFVFLGDLALVTQQYGIYQSFSVPFLLFWLALAPMPYVLHSRPFAFIADAAFVAWIVTEISRDGSPLHTNNPTGVFLVLGGIGATILAIATAHRLTRYASLAGPSEVVGGSVMLFSLYILGFYRRFEFDVLVDRPVAAAVLLVPAVLVLAALAADSIERRRAHRTSTGRLPIYVGATLLAAFLLLSLIVSLDMHTNEVYVSIAFWVLAIAFMVELGWLGVTYQRSGWRNAALAFAGLFLISRYFDLFGSYGQTGLTFIGAGVLLLVVAFAIERSRRLLTRMTEAQP